MSAGRTACPSGPEDRIRVLLVIKCLGYGGAERLLVDTVARGDRQSFDYEVAYVLVAEDALVPAIRADGTQVHALGASHNWDVRWMAKLRRVLLSGRFDVVHFHLPYTAALGRLVVSSLPKSRRPAIIYTEHSLWNKMALPLKGLNRATIGLDQALLVVSQPAHDALPNALKSRARVLVHGVDLSRAQALHADRDQIRRGLRAQLEVPDSDLLVLTVANLRPEKGYDVLLEAARRVIEMRLPIRFAAIGRGPLEEELTIRHRALGLGDSFRFLGQRDDVLEVLTGADIFVLASRQEGLPVVLMEATSVGLPIVATAVGGVPQVLTDEVDALIVLPGRPDDLAVAIERLSSDPALRLRLGEGAKARSAIFDVAKASREIEHIYSQLARTGS